MTASRTADFCAIDFGTSNSAIALPQGGSAVRLVTLEDGQPTMPTAVFYGVEDLAPHEPPQRRYGRAAVRAYVEGHEGRLMRSMKSILGSTLADQGTDVGAGRSVRYLDVVSDYLRHLRDAAAAAAGGSAPTRVVLGRPVQFVDDDPVRDARAQQALEQAARAVGFADISFQFEPIAAALDFESTLHEEQLVLVADVGGGTSDFSLVRLGPARHARSERAGDILANHGVHIAGTDFDRHVDLLHILPLAGHRSRGPGGREVPSRIYHDLATWHLVNTASTPARIAEIRQMRSMYDDRQLHARLLMVLERRLGHALLGAAEQAKIDVAEHGATRIDLAVLEQGLERSLTDAELQQALSADLDRITEAADETLRRAGARPADVQALYLTGGSTGLTPLVQRLAALLPHARVARGDRFASVATGLGHTARLRHA